MIAVFFTFAVIAIVYASVRVVFGPRPVLAVEDETNDGLVAIRDRARDGDLIQGTAGRLHYPCVDAIIDRVSDEDKPCGTCKQIVAEVWQ
jgi:hypothetical protein